MLRKPQSVQRYLEACVPSSLSTMDLHSFATSLSSITLYDIKNVYNQVNSGFFPLQTRQNCCFKAKNVVLNISEMEAKVRDATSDEPWYIFLFFS